MLGRTPKRCICTEYDRKEDIKPDGIHEDFFVQASAEKSRRCRRQPEHNLAVEHVAEECYGDPQPGKPHCFDKTAELPPASIIFLFFLLCLQRILLLSAGPAVFYCSTRPLESAINLTYVSGSSLEIRPAPLNIMRLPFSASPSV